MKNKKISIVGCGPGSTDYITPAAFEAVRRADVLVGAKRLITLFPESTAKTIEFGSDTEKTLDNIDRCNTSVAVLVSGDSGLFSLAKPVINRFGRERCEIIPGISSVQMAFARVGVDWEYARIISTHAYLPDMDLESLAASDKIAVLAGGRESMQWIGKLLDSIGESHTVFACENLTMDGESVRQFAPEQLTSTSLASRTIVLMIKKGLLE